MLSNAGDRLEWCDGPSASGTQQRQPSLAATLMAPGALSIVMQGALLRAEADRLAEYCLAWRSAFPRAQLICAISSSDCIANVPSEGGVVRAFAPLPALLVDTRLEAALRTIEMTCDVIVFAHPERPLPPIKSDSPGPNHTNLMIAAAHAGLAWADGHYVLRIRNDLLLRGPGFVAAFESGTRLPRGDWSLFRQRVVIPEVFTLNPLTLSHMPFHYSDWFHFGRREDVCAIWNEVSYVSQADAAFYDDQPHGPESNVVERRFRSRLAPEQTISFPVFHRAFPALQLARHNDGSCTEESLLVLADNFVVANLAECRAVIAKYQHVVDAMSPYTRLECVSQAIVNARVVHPGVPARTLFAGLIRRTERFEWGSYRAMRYLGRRFRRFVGRWT